MIPGHFSLISVSLILKFFDCHLDSCFHIFQHEGVVYNNISDVIFPLEPNVEAIDRKAGDAMKAFKDLVFPDDYDPGGKPAPKRKVFRV